MDSVTGHQAWVRVGLTPRDRNGSRQACCLAVRRSDLDTLYSLFHHSLEHMVEEFRVELLPPLGSMSRTAHLSLLAVDGLPQQGKRETPAQRWPQSLHLDPP